MGWRTHACPKFDWDKSFIPVKPARDHSGRNSSRRIVFTTAGDPHRVPWAEQLEVDSARKHDARPDRLFKNA